MARHPPSLLSKVRAGIIGFRSRHTPAQHIPHTITAADALAEKRARQSQYAAPRVQAIVQQYSDTLRKLYNSLADDSSQRVLIERKIHDARMATVLARASLLRLKVEQKRAEHLALHDGLTALPNRRFLLERLDRVLADAQPGRQALALLGMEFNSRQTLHGSGTYQCNDALFKIVAARLNRAVRSEDIVCRLGGDEFACLVPGLPSRAQLGQLVSKVLDTVSAPLKIGSLEVFLQLNVGVAVFPADGATGDALLDSAVAAMRFATQQKSHCAFFNRRCLPPGYGFAGSMQRD
jgi:diguanylate cyclase (GGDEF)-like protein